MDFLNWLFLAGLATALAPILIHLVQRRRVQQVVFGSLRFLRKTSHRVVHRRRFEELLLVILRALALAVLALAFARPFFRKPAEEPAAGTVVVGQEAVLVLVDNSYSMRAEGRLGRAKQEALKFLREADPAAKVGVAAFSSQFAELCPVGSTPQQAEEAIQGILPSWRGTRLNLALEQASRVLTRAGRDEAHRRIVLVSDFQDSSWEKRSDWTLAPGVELTVRNVATRPVPNVFVARVVVPRLVVAGGFVEVIAATVRNLTEKPLNDARVVFRVNGEEKGTLSVNLRPGEEAPVRFRHKFTEPGDVFGTLAIEADDELPEDNVAHFCVHVTPRVHVLLVNADRAEKMVLNDGQFVRTALVPGTEGVVSPFEVREVAPEEMKPADLDGADVVLFLNVSKLPSALTQPSPARAGDAPAEPAEFRSPVGRFVAAGGGIGFVCGPKVIPEEFNRTFGALAPCKLLRLAREGDAPAEPPVVINQVDLRHEIFAEFAQPHSGDVSVAEFSQYFLVTDSQRAQVPARFSHRDAHPALVELSFPRSAWERGGLDAPRPSPTQSVGAARSHAERGNEGGVKGKSLLFVSSLDLEWNNLCLKSVFVPFVHQVVKRLCARRTGSARNFAVADEVSCSVPEDAGPVTLRRSAAREGAERRALSVERKALSVGREAQENKDAPRSTLHAPRPQDAPRSTPPAPPPASPDWEAPVELKPHVAGGSDAVGFSPEQPGLYQVAYKGGSACFAINLDPNEPDLRPLDTKLLLSAVQKELGLEGKTAPGGGPVLSRATWQERLESRQRAWWYLVLTVLAVLGAEMWLATRIGRA